MTFGIGYYAMFATKISGTTCKYLYQQESWGIQGGIQQQQQVQQQPMGHHVTRRRRMIAKKKKSGGSLEEESSSSSSSSKLHTNKCPLPQLNYNNY